MPASRRLGDDQADPLIQSQRASPRPARTADIAEEMQRERQSFFTNARAAAKKPRPGEQDAAFARTLPRYRELR